MKKLIKYKFRYGGYKNETVTVVAYSLVDAEINARNELDRRCDKRNEEPPISWSLKLIDTREHKK